MSQARPSRRPVAAFTPEPEVPVVWNRQTWLALVVMGAVIAVVIGSGVLISKALQPPVPAALASCKTSTQIGQREYIGLQPMCITATQQLTATITTSQGDVVVKLHPEIAPVTVNNFVVLAIHGYYNGLIFWKAEDWVVQNGDPQGNGTGGPGYNLPEERSNDAWDIGAIGMARIPGGPVNGSQFFIEKAAWPGNGPTAVYNRFGTVTSGMDKVQALGVTDTINSITIKVS
ncbi:MAG TPA: peptidylprolyl isomerase [Candidatus Dormibacteraeota bacterium]|nr:peptidylprolyl isomerase [Candidatus Dormibacteraeota bacterium]